MKLSSEQSFYKKILKQKLFKNLYVLLLCLIFLSYPFSVNANEDLIMNPKTGKYIKVSEFEKAEATEQWDNELSCLITSNNTIPIGEYTFWDWED